MPSNNFWNFEKEFITYLQSGKFPRNCLTVADITAKIETFTHYERSILRNSTLFQAEVFKTVPGAVAQLIPGRVLGEGLGIWFAAKMWAYYVHVLELVNEHELQSRTQLDYISNLRLFITTHFNSDYSETLALIWPLLRIAYTASHTFLIYPKRYARFKPFEDLLLILNEIKEEKLSARDEPCKLKELPISAQKKLATVGFDLHNNINTIQRSLVTLCLFPCNFYMQWAPLHYAAYSGDLNLLSTLLQYGANINQAVDGWTPLMFAAQAGRADAINYLLQQEGIDLSQGGQGKKALSNAESSSKKPNDFCLFFSKSYERFILGKKEDYDKTTEYLRNACSPSL